MNSDFWISKWKCTNNLKYICSYLYFCWVSGHVASSSICPSINLSPLTGKRVTEQIHRRNSRLINYPVHLSFSSFLFCVSADFHIGGSLSSMPSQCVTPDWFMRQCYHELQRQVKLKKYSHALHIKSLDWDFFLCFEISLLSSPKLINNTEKNGNSVKYYYKPKLLNSSVHLEHSSKTENMAGFLFV